MRVSDILGDEGLIEDDPLTDASRPVADITRTPTEYPMGRDARLQTLARGDEGFLLALAYSTQRGYARSHPLGEIRIGEVDVEVMIPELGFTVVLGRVQLTECQMVNQFQGSAKVPPQFTRGYGLVFGQAERKAMAMSLCDRALRASRTRRGHRRAGPGRGIRAVALRQCAGDRLRRASQAAALRRLPGRTRPGAAHARRAFCQCGEGRWTSIRDRRKHGGRGMNAPAKDDAEPGDLQFRLSRRADQADDPPRDPQGDRRARLPGAVRQPRDADALWLGHRRRAGDGGDHRARRCAQGDRPGCRRHHQRGLDPGLLRQDRRVWRTTTSTPEATIIQTRHRIPETPLTEGQVLVYQVPIPEPLRFLEPRETETRKMHALEEYGLMHVKLYEDIARNGHIATTYAYPVKVEGRYVMDPSPTPKFDNPKMHQSRKRCSCSARAGRRRIYAIPPHTEVVSLDFEDHPFEIQHFEEPCALCGAEQVYLDEVVLDDKGGRMFVCSDTHYCESRQAEGHRGLARQGRGSAMTQVLKRRQADEPFRYT
jgi:hypothetical protein